MQVPKNKTIYRGGRRFIEGEIIPPYLTLPEDIPEQVTKKKTRVSKPKRGRTKKREIY